MKKSILFWNFLRKGIHLSSIFILVGYTLLLNFFSNQIAILVLTGLLLLILEIEYIRLEHRPKIIKIFNKAFKKHEKNNITGAPFLIISCIICFAAFDYWIAILALFMAVFGDIISGLFGKVFGRKKLYKEKTFVGFLSGLITNLLVGILILPSFLFLVVIMSLVASFVELFTSKLDDNLTVPLFAGFIGQIIVFLFKLNLPKMEFTFLGFF